jgi:hypothetical protein
MSASGRVPATWEEAAADGTVKRLVSGGAAETPRPWTEAHRWAAIQRFHELCLELIRGGLHDGAAAWADEFTEAAFATEDGWRCDLANTGFDAARIDGEVAIVRAMAERPTATLPDHLGELSAIATAEVVRQWSQGLAGAPEGEIADEPRAWRPGDELPHQFVPNLAGGCAVCGGLESFPVHAARAPVWSDPLVPAAVATALAGTEDDAEACFAAARVAAWGVTDELDAQRIEDAVAVAANGLRAWEHLTGSRLRRVPVDEAPAQSSDAIQSIRELRDIATGKIEHVFAGGCPDVSIGSETVRAEPGTCPACDAFRRADAVLGQAGSEGANTGAAAPRRCTRIDSVIRFLREAFRDDGAEGESVHLLCREVEAMTADLERAHEEIAATRGEAAHEIALAKVSASQAALPELLRAGHALDAGQIATVIRVVDALAAGVGLGAREMLGREARWAHVDHDDDGTWWHLGETVRDDYCRVAERLFAIGRASVVPPDADLARVIAAWSTITLTDQQTFAARADKLARSYWRDTAERLLCETVPGRGVVLVSVEFALQAGVKVIGCDVDGEPATVEQWAQLRAAGVPVAEGVGV